MVQTPEQYQFIYAALVEHILFGNTEFEADDLNNVMEENLTQLPGGVNGFSHQVSIVLFFYQESIKQGGMILRIYYVLITDLYSFHSRHYNLSNPMCACYSR